MNRKEAEAVIKRRNRARKKLKKCRNALWSGRFEDFGNNQERLLEAQAEFYEASELFPQALKVIL